MKYCKNCGKLINPSTLVCDACGTDYNDKPKCEHFYTDWVYDPDPVHLTVKFMLRCGKCHETIMVECSENMIKSMLDEFCFRYGRRY
jgi:hypothetical protein